MSFFDEDRDKRRRRDPFDFFGVDDEFERVFREMERMMERIFRGPGTKIEPGKSFVHGFNIHIGPDGKPHVQEFGNRSLMDANGRPSISEEREPLTDVIEGKDEISVTLEIPGVEKEDIDLQVTKNKLKINVDTPHRKYHKEVDLPSPVKPKTTDATYKNGVLDIVIKKEEKTTGEGYRVNVR